MLAARFSVARASAIAASLVPPKPKGILDFPSALTSFTTHLPGRSCATFQLAGRGPDAEDVLSLILTSQQPVAKWHEQIGDPTLADSILDRLVHNAHRIEMRGESMRKERGGKKA